MLEFGWRGASGVVIILTVRANATMTSREWLLLIALSMIWGASYFFFKILDAQLSPLTTVMARVVFSTLILLAIVVLSGKSMPASPGVWGAFAIMGLLNNVIPFTLIIWSELRISSGLASILNATTPLFAVVLAHFLTRDERLSANKVVGVIVGLFGVVVLIGLGALRTFNLTNVAQLACIGAALSYAGAGIYGRRFKTLGIAPLVAATGQFAASAVIVTPLALTLDRPWRLPPPSAETWLALAGLVVLSTVIAYIMYFQILASAGATNVLLVTLLIPVSALILGTLLLKEPLVPRDLVGMLLIGCGLLAIDGRVVSWAQGALYQGRSQTQR